MKIANKENDFIKEKTDEFLSQSVTKHLIEFKDRSPVFEAVAEKIKIAEDELLKATNRSDRDECIKIYNNLLLLSTELLATHLYVKGLQDSVKIGSALDSEYLVNFMKDIDLETGMRKEVKY